MRRWLPVETINRLAGDPSRCMSAPDVSSIDMTKPFVPEDYTQLYYTPAYADLCHEERLRYNQLFGVRINEYIMMLEADLVERLLRPLRRHPSIRGDAPMVEAIDTMIREEHEHYAEFLRLNRLCLPGDYEGGVERVFATTPVAMRALLGALGMSARWLAFPMWFLMAMEESSMALARDMAKRPETENLGPLEPGFVSFHREHMKDEMRHVHLDGHIIEACIDRAGGRTRDLNATLFKRMVGAMTKPERAGSGVKVIRRLVRDIPTLKRKEAALVDAVLSLGRNRDYQASLFNRGAMPLTFGVFDASASLSDLGEAMPGYDRR